MKFSMTLFFLGFMVAQILLPEPAYTSVGAMRYLQEQAQIKEREEYQEYLEERRLESEEESEGEDQYSESEDEESS